MNRDEPQICAHCGGDIDFEEVIWITPDGDVSLDGDGADPYHEMCVP